MSAIKVAAFSDFHSDPDPASLRIALDFLKDFKPDKVIFNGDILDIASIGKFADPNDCSLKDEFDIARDLIESFDISVWLDGNHENRIKQAKYVPVQWQSMFSVPEQLELKKRGIIYRPYRRDGAYRIRNFTYLHGFSCGATAGRKVASLWGNCAIGHTHRVNQNSFPSGAGAANCYELGCMCKLDQGYNMQREPAAEQNGFGFGYHYKSGSHQFYTVRIDKKKALINGKEYK